MAVMETALASTAARRDLPIAQVRADASAWIAAWWTEVLAGLDEEVPAELGGLIQVNAAHYAVWGRVGADVDSGPGFLALHKFAIRDARGSVERGTEAASETWIDVRGRLEQTVARSLKGRSVPDFRRPGPIGEDNVHRYHVIQARLRLAGKWTKRKAEEAYDDTRHAAEWAKPFRAAEARTYAAPLHFSAWWTLLDLKTRTTRDGRLKGPAWWWQMLLHALDVEKVDELGGDRNDPTEALLRMRIRFVVSQGIAPWLKGLGIKHAYWRQVDFGLPNPENTVARESVVAALAVIKPALAEAIEAMGLSAAEEKVLKGTLIRGENVRTSIQGMTGDNANERQARLVMLAEQAGRDAGKLLGHGGGGGVGGGGGGGRGHEHVTGLMARMASGEPPEPSQVMLLNAAVAECAHCRAHWLGTVEAPNYLAAAASEFKPVPTRSRAPWAMGSMVAMAAAAMWVVGVGLPVEDAQIGLRGAQSAAPVHLDLFVVPDGGTESERFVQTQSYHLGDTVFFRVSADQPSDVSVWVDGPEGFGELGAQPVGAKPVNLGEKGQATWYRFEGQGRYVFMASSAPPRADGVCDAPGCVSREVEVLP
jgi:hypothetical protein